MTPADIPATARSIWITITEATRYPTSLPIPVSYHAFTATPDHGQFVVLRLETAAEAQQWAKWTAPDVRASWGQDGSVTYFANRNGWSWHLSAAAPTAEQVAAAALRPDSAVFA